MAIINIEIKAHCAQPKTIKEILSKQQARYHGTDHQIDTYFKVPFGRLKLREGNIENALIHYCRPDKTGPKRSEVLLYDTQPQSNLKALLIKSLGVLTVVDKYRDIYFIDNVKFHLDAIDRLGTFLEIEAIDQKGNLGTIHLQEQCNFYLRLFDIQKRDLIDKSYSDLLLMKGIN